MFNGWISLRVQDPKAISEWYQNMIGLHVIGGRDDIGSFALGSTEHGYAIILLPGPITHFPWNVSHDSTSGWCPKQEKSTFRRKIARCLKPVAAPR
jgi:hypothetical protein